MGKEGLGSSVLRKIRDAGLGLPGFAGGLVEDLGTDPQLGSDLASCTC